MLILEIPKHDNIISTPFLVQVDLMSIDADRKPVYSLTSLPPPPSPAAFNPSANRGSLTPLLPPSSAAAPNYPQIYSLPLINVLQQEVKHILEETLTDKGRRKKKVVLSGGWGRGPNTTFGQKSTTFCFWFHTMQKPSKRVKTQ